MEEESTFYPHYEISLIIQYPLKPTKPTMRSTGYFPGARSLQHSLIQPQIIRKDSIPLDTLKQWCDENIGKENYHLGRNKVVVYNEVNAIAIKLRWK